MRIKKRWCIILIFTYFFTYFNTNYEIIGGRPKPYLYVRIENECIFYNDLRYFYREEIESVKKIEILKTNILGMKSILLEKKDLNNIFESTYFEMFLIPFFIKEVSIKSTLKVKNELIEIEEKFKPTFEFGINPFWLIIVDSYNPRRLFKIGGD